MQKNKEKINFYLEMFEYITLRLARKVFFNGKIGRALLPLFPYYKKNQNLILSSVIVNSYVKYAQKAKKNLNNLNILEIGIGETNSTGYELIAKFGGKFFAYDPFAKFNYDADKKSLNNVLKKYHLSERYIQNRLVRINDLTDLKKRAIDVIFSNSVLEHVSNFDNLIKNLKTVLNPKGYMIHIVDYRDHFFKYPYSFLLFSKETWDKFLNPGDLPRYRLKDHRDAFTNNGYNIKILAEKTERNKFENIKSRINPLFNKFSEDEISITYAALLVE